MTDTKAIDRIDKRLGELRQEKDQRMSEVREFLARIDELEQLKKEVYGSG